MIRFDILAAFLAVVGFVVYLCVFAVVTVATEAKCLRAGYPTTHVAWSFEKYCTREENEYEVTVTLEEAERGRQD